MENVSYVTILWRSSKNYLIYIGCFLIGSLIASYVQNKPYWVKDDAWILFAMLLFVTLDKILRECARLKWTSIPGYVHEIVRWIFAVVYITSTILFINWYFDSQESVALFVVLGLVFYSWIAMYYWDTSRRKK